MIKLKINSRRNPQDNQAPELFYLRAIKKELVDFERLAYLISNQSTVREPDCLAVLRALEHNMLDQLGQGNVVQLGSLGNFQVGVRSEGTATAEEQSPANIRSVHLNYRAGKRIKKALKSLDYTLISTQS
jgi:predicted histone-like DNA-binding protein